MKRIKLWFAYRKYKKELYKPYKPKKDKLKFKRND